ncbi:DEAD/DEAH box helicase family protein [Polaromonas sp. P1(28)-8]|nr:DEAD/DEAH box helicase family protein [Polaromonas sp. P1(28)-8]
MTGISAPNPFEFSEADTCREFVTPAIQAAYWGDTPFEIAEQRSFTDGRIVLTGRSAKRREGKRADYLLRYRRDLTLAVVEAKPYKSPAGDGLQQAKDYAEILGLKFAYATNGREIIEFDFLTGIEQKVDRYPTPDELWHRQIEGTPLASTVAVKTMLQSLNHNTGKPPRYYQEIAINRTIGAILSGQKRILLTMATGTGKTPTAFHIVWKLWNSGWNKDADPTRKTRVLFLADRNILVDDPKDKTFAVFGDARWKIEGGEAIKGREIYFSTYQSIAEDERRTDKRVAELDDNQSALIRAVRQRGEAGQNMLLDGHFVLRGTSGELVRLAKEVFADLQLSGVVLLTEDAQIIVDRLIGRDGIAVNPELIAELAAEELAHAYDVCGVLQVPLTVLHAPNIQMLTEVVNRLFLACNRHTADANCAGVCWSSLVSSPRLFTQARAMVAAP